MYVTHILAKIVMIKRIEWNNDKNQQLKKERNLSFEQIQVAIEQDGLIDIIQHPRNKYEHQQIMIINIEDYLVLVPFVEDNEKIFLKTAFKSRKMTKEYVRSKSHDTKSKH